MINDVKAFHEKFGFFISPRPAFISDYEMKMRLDFQLEELLETAHAAGFYFNSDQMEFRRQHNYAGRNLPDTLDGLVDQVYVALGTAVAMGFDARFKMAWGRVHAANMKKEKTLGTYKVVKPAGWQRPNLEDLCE